MTIALEQWMSQDSSQIPAAYEQLVAEHFDHVFVMVNAFVGDGRQAMKYTDAVFRMLDPEEVHSPHQIYAFVGRFISSLSEMPGLVGGLRRVPALCLLLREIVYFTYDEIAVILNLSRDEVMRNIYDARQALVCS